jgi:uncharacterized protein
MRAILAIVAVVFIAAYFLGGVMYSQTIYVYERPKQGCAFDVSQLVFEPYSANITRNPNMSSAVVVVPAVDQDGNGVATVLHVQVVPGSGKSLVNIDKLLFWVDTQNSIRTARNVAENVVGMDLSDRDIVYTITANASVVEGPSAGAALTVATIAAARGNETDPTVMMTGTINENGAIGPIGGTLEKAKAAKSIGAKKFLVPRGQSVEVTYENQRVCEKRGPFEYCTIEAIRKTTDIANVTGIEVVEVSNINDALEHFMV